jgi:dGTPase
MTLEGCVVRFADTISYIGRDIEDAIRLGVLARPDLPRECVRVLGDTNGTIVYTLVTDVIRDSYGRDHIAFSPEVSEALFRLKRFNLERIYMNPVIKRHTEVIRDLFAGLFHRFLTDLKSRNRSSPIFTGFLDGMSADYISCHRPPEIVRDFIAGMTDQYFLKQCPPDRVSRLVMP